MNIIRLFRVITFLLYFLLFDFTLTAQNNSYYVSENGSDDNTGASSSPFKTIEYALTNLNDNDELILKAGTYREVIKIGRNFPNNIHIVGQADQEVFVNVTHTLPVNWVLWKEGIWKMQIDFDIWQLFNNDELVQVARWPNATFQDSSIWRMTESMRYTDGGYNNENGVFTGKCSNGIIYDAPFPEGYTGVFNEGDSNYVTSNTESLVESNIDFTDAIAVLNVGHWLTWARKISSHTQGDDHFSYADPIAENSLQKHFAYYILGLPALDSENEWWFDADTQTIYYYPPAGVNPNEMDLQARTEDFAIELNRAENITFQNITFFGGGFNIRNSVNINFLNCNFYYPSTHKFMLNELAWFLPWNNAENTGENKMSTFHLGRNNKIINCEFAYSNAPINFGGDNILVDNCYFHDIEWDVNSSGGTGSIMIGEAAVFRNNTIHRSGNSEGLRPTETNAIVEYNHLFDMGNLQHDGAGINVGTDSHYGTRLSHNWVHDCNRQGIRFDYNGNNVVREDGEVYGDGVYMKNVTWNTQPNQVKGDRHLILNNTIVNCNTFPIPEEERMNISIQGFRSMHGLDFNESSLTRNNIANMTHRSWNFDGGRVSAYQIPGIVDHNNKEPGAAYKYLNSPEIYDFRPKEDSPLIDAGEVVQAQEINSPVANFSSISFFGDAPDIGAYEYGDIHYWIPGRKEEQASFPIPAHNSTEIEYNQDLLFRNGYQATGARVYFGTRESLITNANNQSDALLTTLTEYENIIKLSDFNIDLRANTTYYWRIDIITSSKTIKGKVWEFTTKKDANASENEVRSNTIKVHPNPTMDLISFSGHDVNTSYVITNVNGIDYKQGILQKSEQSISIAHLPEGVYVIHFPDSIYPAVQVLKY
jgi:hypothetical protein